MAVDSKQFGRDMDEQICRMMDQHQSGKQISIDDLADEVRALRKAVEALRPKPSTILTGAEVVQEWHAMNLRTKE